VKAKFPPDQIPQFLQQKSQRSQTPQLPFYIVAALFSFYQFSFASFAPASVATVFDCKARLIQPACIVNRQNENNFVDLSNDR
jgi:hypothetical protein